MPSTLSVFASRSTTRIATPPAISAQATTTAFSSSASIWSSNASPSTTAGTNASSRLRTNATASGSQRSSPLRHRQERAPVQHDDRQDRARLDRDVEHRPALRAS